MRQVFLILFFVSYSVFADQNLRGDLSDRRLETVEEALEKYNARQYTENREDYLKSSVRSAGTSVGAALVFGLAGFGFYKSKDLEDKCGQLKNRLFAVAAALSGITLAVSYVVGTALGNVELLKFFSDREELDPAFRRSYISEIANDAGLILAVLTGVAGFLTNDIYARVSNGFLGTAAFGLVGVAGTQIYKLINAAWWWGEQN